VLVAVSAASLAAWLRTSHTGGSSGPCVSVVIASTMGGATIEHCGAAAVSFCRENAADPQIAAACRREGF